MLYIIRKYKFFFASIKAAIVPEKSLKEYAVVYFYGDKTYSEIPVSWLLPDNSHCYWPNKKNPYTLMQRLAKPVIHGEDKWDIFPVQVETYCCKYT